MFWATTLLLIVPFPFKLFSMVTGKDQRSFAVKFEEMSNAIFLAIGLIAFWQFAYLDTKSTVPIFWYAWLFVAVSWSLLAAIKSPKLDYAKEQIGAKNTIIISALSTLFFLPMFIAVYNHAG